MVSDWVTLACPSCQRTGHGSPVHATWCPECGELMDVVDGPWRDDKVWVLTRKCGTCIFRPGNQMHLRDGRVDAMVADCIADNRVIPCHQTLDGPRSVCRGLFDVHRDDIMILRLAQAMKVLAFDDPPEEH